MVAATIPSASCISRPIGSVSVASDRPAWGAGATGPAAPGRSPVETTARAESMMALGTLKLWVRTILVAPGWVAVKSAMFRNSEPRKEKIDW